MRHYHGGLEDWTAAGLALETAEAPEASPALPQPSPAREAGSRFITRRIHARQWGNKLVDLIDRQSTSRLFLAWLAMTILCGVGYWLFGVLHLKGLVEDGRPVGTSLRSFATAMYFSFVTVTSLGFGDVLPTGASRVLSIVEAVSGLLIFGAVISKFVSRRQDELVREIARVTFEERLDRIQTNLHMVLSELQAIGAMFADGSMPVERVSARLESAALVFATELRTVHYLLYRPQQAPEEPLMAAILASLASSLNTLFELLRDLPAGTRRSPILDRALKALSRMAGEICADCVPPGYAPSLRIWMDRIHDTAQRIA